MLDSSSRAPSLQRLATLDSSACWFEATQHELALGAFEERWGDAWPGPDESLRDLLNIERGPCHGGAPNAPMLAKWAGQQGTSRG